MTEQEFIDHMVGYGTHVQHKYGNDIIEKRVHLTPQNSYFTNFPYISGGRKYHMEFEINGKKASVKECAQLISTYKRIYKLEKLGI